MARNMTNGLDVEQLPAKELEILLRNIEQAIPERRKAEVAALREKFTALAAEAGYTLEEVMGSRGPKKVASKSAVAVKYRNPENPAETWTGRGRMASWLAGKLKKRGAKLEDFAV